MEKNQMEQSRYTTLDLRIKGKLLASFALDMVYPRRCPVCHDIAVSKGEGPYAGNAWINWCPSMGRAVFKCSKPPGGQ